MNVCLMCGEEILRNLREITKIRLLREIQKKKNKT